MATMDDALNTFIIEGRELLEQMEEALLRVEQMPDDADTINAIFRAAHTIKGSAGLFGIDHIVAFTHAAENVLDKVRNAEIRATSELVALMLSVRDHLGVLLDHVAAGNEPDPDTHQVSHEIIGRLQACLGLPAPAIPATCVKGETPKATVTASQETPKDGAIGHSDHWHLSLRFDPCVLKNGMDPVAFIRYLTTLGEIRQIITITEHVPRLAEMDPEDSYLGYEIAFASDADKQAIEEAFEFVRDDAQIRILPPHSRISEYQRLIDAQIDDELPIGEILVRCGTLTPTELAAALDHQASAPVDERPPIGEVLVEQRVVRPQVIGAALDKQSEVKERKAVESAMIRVNAEKLDEHINLIGELIIASAGTTLIAQRSNNPALLEAAARLSRLVEEVRDSALTLRMVQIGATFNKFQRLIRDMSTELKKDIHLEISGADTELDKTVVEKIGDPLTHLVRNSVDHGIEPVDVRLARGKPACGTIRLNAYHDSGSIVIEVSDDGGGLNRTRILEKALERGLIKPDQALSDTETCNLIFEPGFSTAEKIGNLSGRGVGMDVVRKNILALRGTIEIDSQEGIGTTMRIRLPLTLAIIDGFLVGVSNSSFVVPLDMVVECVELSADETAAAQGRDHINLRGEVLPFIRLKDLFEIPERGETEAQEDEEFGQDFRSTAGVTLSPEGAAALAADPELDFILHPPKRENIVVVQYAGHRIGLVVDRLMGEFQTVIRPLGIVFDGLKGISGFTILGNGHVALILEVPGLVSRVAARERERLTGAEQTIQN